MATPLLVARSASAFRSAWSLTKFCDRLALLLDVVGCQISVSKIRAVCRVHTARAFVLRTENTKIFIQKSFLHESRKFQCDKKIIEPMGSPKRFVRITFLEFGQSVAAQISDKSVEHIKVKKWLQFFEQRQHF